MKTAILSLLVAATLGHVQAQSNTLSLSQAGSGNSAPIMQAGSENTLSVSQTGTGNIIPYGSIYQQ